MHCPSVGFLICDETHDQKGLFWLHFEVTFHHREVRWEAGGDARALLPAWLSQLSSGTQDPLPGCAMALPHQPLRQGPTGSYSNRSNSLTEVPSPQLKDSSSC